MQSEKAKGHGILNVFIQLEPQIPLNQPAPYCLIPFLKPMPTVYGLIKKKCPKEITPGLLTTNYRVIAQIFLRK